MFSFLTKACLALASLVLLAAPAAAETWYRAETHHFTIYSNGSKSQLEDFSHEVERFDALLRLLWNKKSVDEPNKLTIYLIEDADDVDALLGPKKTNVAGFYRPSTEGSIAVGNRDSTRQTDRLSGKRVLFHEYAHHFLFQNFSVPVPAWFIEGFAEFVATAEFKRKGEWTFGKPALHRVNEIEYFGSIPIRDLLTKMPERSAEGDAFYGWSWALTHMLYSEEMGRGKLVVQYLNSINRGTDPLEAAEATFGDLDKLDRSLRNYIRKSIAWNKSPNAIPYREEVTITELSDYDSQVTDLTLRRLGGQEEEEVRAELRALSASPGATSEVWYQLADAEYALVHDDDAEQAYDFTAAEAAVDQALALDADHMQANVLKGQILLEAFDHADETDEANWDKARQYFLRANKSNPSHPWPLYAYANSFLREGKSDPQITPSLTTAYKQAPESSELRFAYALDLARHGRYALAIKTLQVLANNPHGGDGAQSAIERIESMMAGGAVPASIEPDEDEDVGGDMSDDTDEG